MNITELSRNENFIKINEVMCASCPGWSDLTLEEQVKVYCRGHIIKDMEISEWHAEGEDYKRWARKMFIETGFCFSKPQYDYIFGSFTSEDGLLKAANANGKTLFKCDSSGNNDEIAALLKRLRGIRMSQFNKTNSPKLITVMYYTEHTEEDNEIMKRLYNLGFPCIV